MELISDEVKDEHEKIVIQSLRDFEKSQSMASKNQTITKERHQTPVTFSVCNPPNPGSAQYVITYRRPRSIRDLLTRGYLPIDFGTAVTRCPDFFLGCVKVSRPNSRPDDNFDPSLPDLEFHYGVDLKFDQTWNVTALTLGDLSSTISLAPSEQLTLEFLSSQRILLEKKTLDSREEMNSVENTTADKEVVNVARSSSRTENWNVSANANVSLGSIVGLGSSGGASASSTTSSQTSLQQIREATRKSAQSLKTLHKIEIRGVTETLIQNRMTRVIKNPYRDRALSLNIFQLLKHFSVKTELAEIRPVLLIKVGGLQWDDNFVASHVEFLQNYLLDSTLLDDLPQAIIGAKQLPNAEQYEELVQTSRKALEYLFEKPNIFHVPPHPEITDIYGGIRNVPPNADPNLVETTFDPGVSFVNWPITMTAAAIQAYSGFWAAREEGMAKLYTILQFLYAFYIENRNAGKLNDIFVVEMVRVLKETIDTQWEQATAEVKKLMVRDVSSDAYIEIFRRLSGFRSIIKGFIQWRLDILDAWGSEYNEKQKNRKYTIRLIEHLNCNNNYYVQQFLAYIARKTNNQTIVDFVKQVIDSLDRTPLDRFIKTTFNSVFDFERVFVDRQQLVVPAFWYLPPEADHKVYIPMIDSGPEVVDLTEIKPIVENDIIVPLSDGIHMEVAPGACTLKEVPEPIIEQPSIVLKCECLSCKDKLNDQYIPSQESTT